MSIIPRTSPMVAVVLAASACAVAVAQQNAPRRASGAAPAAHRPDPDPARFEAEIRAFAESDRKNSVPRRAVLFVGSSSIRMWPTAESFPDLPVVNRGFGGSHISDVNHYVDAIVLKYAPQVIVFYAGDNDVEAGKTPQQVFDDFQAFIDAVHKRLPHAQIIYLPIKPSLARWPKWPQMLDVNARVQELSMKNKQLIYVDTATPMLGADGRPRAEFFLDDGLHLNANGYTEWTAIVKAALRQFLAANQSDHPRDAN